MRLLNYLFNNPGTVQTGRSVRLLDYVSSPTQGGGDTLQRTKTGRGSALDAQEAQRDYSASGWAFDNQEDGFGFGGFGGFGGREFDATQDEPFTVDLWKDD